MFSPRFARRKGPFYMESGSRKMAAFFMKTSQNHADKIEILNFYKIWLFSIFALNFSYIVLFFKQKIVIFRIFWFKKWVGALEESLDRYLIWKYTSMGRFCTLGANRYRYIIVCILTHTAILLTKSVFKHYVDVLMIQIRSFCSEQRDWA